MFPTADLLNEQEDSNVVVGVSIFVAKITQKIHD